MTEPSMAGSRSRARWSLWVAAALITAVGLHGRARAESEAPPASPAPSEIKKTVDAFRGHWDVTGTDAEPGAPAPSHFRITMDCRPAALGAAVSCLFAGTIPGVGAMEASSVIGYSPDEKVVRWMEISSTGEYHDHRGRWKGETLDFEPLEFSVSGEKATELLSVGFPSPGRLTLHSVTKTPEGSSTLDCTGKRVPEKPH